MQLQEKTQLKQQAAEYDTAFNTYVEQSAAAAEAREVEYQQRRREMNVKARQVLEEQMHDKQVCVWGGGWRGGQVRCALAPTSRPLIHILGFREPAGGCRDVTNPTTNANGMTTWV